MSSSNPEPFRILFVCLGNICRSPLAEGVFHHLARSRELEDRYEVESAGTGAWHVGERPDERSRAVAAKHGIDLPGRARQVEESDLEQFDLLLAMDHDNRRELLSMKDRVNSEVEIRLLRDFDPDADGELEVPDPYYGGPQGFDRVFEMVRRSCESLLDELESRESGASSSASD